jgi:hypothetical protein
LALGEEFERLAPEDDRIGARVDDKFPKRCRGVVRIGHDPNSRLVLEDAPNQVVRQSRHAGEDDANSRL